MPLLYLLSTHWMFSLQRILRQHIANNDWSGALFEITRVRCRPSSLQPFWVSCVNSNWVQLLTQLLKIDFFCYNGFYCTSLSNTLTVSLLHIFDDAAYRDVSGNTVKSVNKIFRHPVIDRTLFWPCPFAVGEENHITDHLRWNISILLHRKCWNHSKNENKRLLMNKMSGVFQSLLGQSTFKTLGFLVTAAQLTWRYGQSLVDDQSTLLIVFVYMNFEVLVVRHAE